MKQTLFLLALAFLLLSGCTAGGDGQLSVADAWGRTSPASAANGAFYMNVVNDSGSDDALLSVATPACGMAELHEMYDQGEGVMGMRPVAGQRIPVPAGETVELKPGGLHVMCMNKTAAFETGETYPLTLTFEKAGAIEVTAEIREQ